RSAHRSQTREKRPRRRTATTARSSSSSSHSPSAASRRPKRLRKVSTNSRAPGPGITRQPSESPPWTRPEGVMKTRREFIQLLGVGGAVFASGLAGACTRILKRTEADDFFFVQLSDTHWGFQGPPNPDAEKT